MSDWAVVTGAIGGAHFNGKGGYAWIPVPKGAKEFALMLGEGEPGEAVRGTLFSPSGKRFPFSCAKQAPSGRRSRGPGEDGEFWKLKLEGVPNLLCLDPDNALMPVLLRTTSP